MANLKDAARAKKQEAGSRPTDKRSTAPKKLFGPRGLPVQDHSDLTRIVNLPRREPLDLKSARAAALVQVITEKYSNGVPAGGHPGAPCACKRIDPERDCIVELLAIQAWALHEIFLYQGLLGAIVAGGGKTIVGILAALALAEASGMGESFVSLMLIPASLVDQIETDYLLLREHFRVPSIVIHKSVASIGVDGEPTLHVLPYSLVQRPEYTEYIEKTLQPHALILDECDKLSDTDTSTTTRILRYYGQQEDLGNIVRVCAWTGSLTTKSIIEYWHTSAICLREGSPMPIVRSVAEDCARALDAVPRPAPEGALKRLRMRHGQTTRDAYRERLAWTPGVIISTDSEVTVAGGTARVEVAIRERVIAEVPEIIQTALSMVRDGRRPDSLVDDGGEDEWLTDEMQIAAYAAQVASGIFYRFIFPPINGVPQKRADIKVWRVNRKNFHKELRVKLMRGEPHLDSKLLCEQAAMRHYGQLPQEQLEDGSYLPTWKSLTWEPWYRVRDTVVPKQQACLLHEFLLEDAADWALSNRGIVWYQMVEFAERLAKMTGLPMYGGGKVAGKALLQTGNRSIIVSMKSHGRGRNGLQFRYNHQLLTQMLASAKMMEQWLARLHRRGQKFEEVLTEYYAHTPELRKSAHQALRQAEYVLQTTGGNQRVLDGWQGDDPDDL